MTKDRVEFERNLHKLYKSETGTITVNFPKDLIEYWRLCKKLIIA